VSQYGFASARTLADLRARGQVSHRRVAPLISYFMGDIMHITRVRGPSGHQPSVESPSGTGDTLPQPRRSALPRSQPLPSAPANLPSQARSAPAAENAATDGSPALPRLPTEMLEKIVKYAKTSDPEATKTMRLVNRKFQNLAESNAAELIVKGRDGLESLKQSGNYSKAKKLILRGNFNESDLEGLPPYFKGKAKLLQQPKWVHFNSLTRDGFDISTAAKAAGIEISEPPERTITWLDRARGLFMDTARERRQEKVEHYMKLGFNSREAAKLAKVKHKEVFPYEFLSDSPAGGERSQEELSQIYRRLNE
jgi:hypothetical protein